MEGNINSTVVVAMKAAEIVPGWQGMDLLLRSIIAIEAKKNVMEVGTIPVRAVTKAMAAEMTMNVNV